MRRREVIAFLGSAAGTLAFAAPAQSSSVITSIGFLSGGSAARWSRYVDAFREGLGNTGFVEGQNIKIEYRWADGRSDRLPTLATDLVSRKVAVIAATGGNAPALAVKAATKTIPIVFTGGGDPVKLGLVAESSHPGGNVTGVANFSATLDAKRLETLHQLVPHTARIAVLINPINPNAETQLTNVQDASRRLGLELSVLNASIVRDFEPAFAAIAGHHVGALIVCADVLFNSERDTLVALEARYAVPTMSPFREFAASGGLASYGTNLADVYRFAGIYTGRILKGEKPGDLPVQLPTKYDLVINLKTAEALGLTVPADLLALADEVIE